MVSPVRDGAYENAVEGAAKCRAYFSATNASCSSAAAKPLEFSAYSEQLFQLALSYCVVASELLHRQGGGEGASAADLQVLQDDVIDALDGQQSLRRRKRP